MYILLFVPKFCEVYSPTTKVFDYILKVKGLSLNFETSLIINFDSMKSLIDKYIIHSTSEQLNVPQNKFVTNKFDEIHTVTIDKQFKLVYDKRMLRKDYTTLPFGYKV